MSLQDLKVWAKTLTPDTLKGNDQRRPIEDEEWDEGWGRLSGVSVQQLNQILFLLTSSSSPNPFAVYLVKEGISAGSQSLEMNGQGITIQETPLLFAEYGNNLDDLSADAPSGYKYYIRKQ
ncbi:hypothetical protein NVP1063O_062 [Vibrio phage 1.063.O._10N.261.45.C7]|nr:hypothetical protein NVP1063O_062 [Vibrio phage 1.063.O._10N.261.45.C7]